MNSHSSLSPTPPHNLTHRYEILFLNLSLSRARALSLSLSVRLSLFLSLSLSRARARSLSLSQELNALSKGEAMPYCGADECKPAAW